MWDTSNLDEGDYSLIMVADDGVGMVWKNVSVSILHRVFIIELDEIQVVPINIVDGEVVTFYILVSNIGNADGGAEIVWMVNGLLGSNILINLEKGEEKLSQFSWIATNGEHTISVSTDTAIKTVSIFVESKIVIEEENDLNVWFYSIPMIIGIIGIIFVHRKWMEFRRISDDDEFEWE